MSDQPELFVHDYGCRLVDHGIVATFRPGVPRPLRVDLHDKAFAIGVRRVEAKPAPQPASGGKQAKPSVEAVAKAIEAIFARGQKGDLTASGDVRMDVLEKEVGYNVGTEDRDAAMELIQPKE